MNNSSTLDWRYLAPLEKGIGPRFDEMTVRLALLSESGLFSKLLSRARKNEAVKIRPAGFEVIFVASVFDRVAFVPLRECEQTAANWFRVVPIRQWSGVRIKRARPDGRGGHVNELQEVRYNFPGSCQVGHGFELEITATSPPNT